MVVGSGGVSTSTDGITWTKSTTFTTTTNRVMFDGTKFIAGMSSTTLYSSTDGMTWTTAGTLPVAASTTGKIVYNPTVNTYVCIPTGLTGSTIANKIYVSVGSVNNWQAITVPADRYSSLSVVNNKFVIVCYYGTIMLQSADGVTWSYATTPDQTVGTTTSSIDVADDTIYALPNYGTTPISKYDATTNAFTRLSNPPYSATGQRVFAFTKFNGNYYAAYGAATSIISVSYTHLTLPTNREV